MNLTLERLGYSKNDRVVIFHADDIGFCEASFEAYKDLIEFGILSSASTLVQCSHFLETAKFCQKNDSKVDMGVHLSLIGEFNMRPIKNQDFSSSLIDEYGIFHKTNEKIFDIAEVHEVHDEIQAQVELAKSSGIDITHIDTHCGTLFHPKFLDIYIKTALDFDVPPLLFRPSKLKENSWRKKIIKLESDGIPLFEKITLAPLDSMDEKQTRMKGIKKNINDLPPGLTYFIIHPAKFSKNLHEITPDWKCRIGDYRVFTDSEFRDFLKNSNIHIIGFKKLKELFQKINKDFRI